MKVAFNRNIMQYTAGGGDDTFQHDHDYLSPTSVVVEIGGNKGERNIGRNTCLHRTLLLQQYRTVQYRIVQYVRWLELICSGGFKVGEETFLF